MTIAAGVVCSDGIILCADTEHSDGESTYQRNKVLSFGDDLIVTGAGNHALIRMMFDKVCDEFKSAHPVNPSDAREILEKVARAVHREHIFEFYQANDPGRPSVELIVGVKCSNGKLALLKTIDSTAYLSEAYEVTGIGHSMFEYWLAYLYRSNLNMDAMAYLAFFMLKEVKKTRENCGGYSVVRKIPSSEFKGPKLLYGYDGRTMADFPDSVCSILSVITDFSVSDQWLKEKLEEFSNHVMAVRHAEKTAQEERDRIKWQ